MTILTPLSVVFVSLFITCGIMPASMTAVIYYRSYYTLQKLKTQQPARSRKLEDVFYEYRL